MLHVLRVEMVINSPWLLSKSWLVQKQTVFGKDSSNPFMADNLPKNYQVDENDGIEVTAVRQIINAVSSKLMLFGLKNDTFVSIKKSNDVVRLQALIDRKKVIITEDTIRQALRLDDVAGVDCLSNEEIFAELGRMGYEKSLVRNVDSPSKFLMYLRFLQLMINVQVDDLSSHYTKYTSPALTQKVFANIRRIGTGFSRVDTPLFDGMFMPQQVQDVEDAVEDEDDDNEVSAKPTPPSLKHVTLPPSPTQEPIPSPPQAESAQPSSPPQQQPSQTDKIAQAIEITKLKQRVRRLEKKRQFKSSGLKRLKKAGTVQRVKSSADTGRLAESQAKVYHLDLEHAEKFLSMQDTDEAEPAEVEEASSPRRIKGVVIKDPEETATASVTMHSEVKSNDKGKGIIIKEPKPLKRQAQIKQDEAFAREMEAELNANINWNDVVDQVKRKEKQDNTVMRYQALKRKPITEAQARKNMMHYNLNQAFLERVKEEVTCQKEEGCKRKGSSLNQNAAKKQRIDEQKEELKAHLQIVVNDDDDVFTKSTSLALKRRFGDALEACSRKISIFRTKDFSDDFLLNTFNTMFEKPNVEANIWREQKGGYRLAKVKSWKLFKSYGVHIITLITTQMFLLVEKKYLLIRFTLEQMLNNVILEVKEESEISLELLSFGVDAVEDFKDIWNGYALSFNVYCKPIRVILGL
nr:hypothetical protein [Tanacetum cinerariifolium]